MSDIYNVVTIIAELALILVVLYQHHTINKLWERVRFLEYEKEQSRIWCKTKCSKNIENDKER